MLVLDNVDLGYVKETDVLKGLSFSLGAGDMRFLTGDSGAGKSSLLRLLFLSLRPSSGYFSLFDHDVAKLLPSQVPILRRKIGVVFQDFRLLSHLTVYDNVALPLRIIGQHQDQYHADVAELIDWVGLKSKIDCLPETLSGGEKQRAAIARAVVTKPQLLLADEPTGNVDAKLGVRLLRLFEELNRMGTTIIFATHDEHLVKRFHHPVLRLSGGLLSVEE